VAYLIDGHNLIGQIRDLRLDDPHDEAKLVERLRRYMARKRKRATVIFDRGLPGGPSRDLSTPSVKVVFAHGGTTADAIILERVRETRDPGGLILVSGDRAILEAAARRKIRVIAPREFAAELDALGVPDEEDPNPHVTPDEIEDWLRLFGDDSGSG
jgi:predicted RNA-binding protein with PIN domain